jgi:hypothetical protein
MRLCLSKSTAVIRFDIPMSNREYDPTLSEVADDIQYATYFWSCGYDSHANRGIFVHEPVLLDDQVLRPVHVFKRSKPIRCRSDVERSVGATLG